MANRITGEGPITDYDDEISDNESEVFEDEQQDSFIINGKS